MMASVEYLNLESLRQILKDDTVKLTKLWRLLVHRMTIIHHEKLPQLESLSPDKIKLLCKMCEVVLFEHGETIDICSGGILFKGSITKLKTGGENRFGEDNKRSSSRQLNKI